MRVDKKKNIKKIKSAIVKNPLATERELAEETNTSKGTVGRVKKEMGQNGAKDHKILEITERDKRIVELGQTEIERRLKNSEELAKMRTVEISQVLRESTARYSIFRGSVTDDQGGLKKPEIELSPEQILTIAKRITNEDH